MILTYDHTHDPTNLQGCFWIAPHEKRYGISWGTIKKAAEELIEGIEDDSSSAAVVKQYDLSDFVPRVKPVDAEHIIILLEHDPLCGRM